MTKAWLKAYRASPAIAGTTLLCAASLLTTQNTIPIGPGTPVRTTWFLLLGVVVLSSLPLYPAFGLLEQSFVRARLNRTGRAAVAAALVATAAVVIGTVAGTLAVVWFILLAALSLLAAVATADKSWAVVLLVGGGTIGFDHMMISSPVSRAMDTVGLPTAIWAYALAWLAFVLLPCPKDS